MLLPALFAHFITQATPILRRQVTPWRRSLTPQLTLLLPMFAHLLAHLPPILDRQIAPRCLRPDAPHQAKLAQEY